MPRTRAVRPKRSAAKLVARNPGRSARIAWGVTRLAGRNPRATAGGARLLGRSARGGTKLWAKGRKAKVAGRAGAKTGRFGTKGGAKALKTGAKTKAGSKALKVAARRRRPARTRFLLTGALAGLGAYFLDPKSGKHRRGKAGDKAGKAMRRGKSETQSKVSHAGGVATGAAHQASPGGGGGRAPAEARLNDPSLARKVESEIFRDPEAPKGAVSVSVENGVVILRGQLDDSGQIDKLATSARQVEGVREVQNLLHTPDRPAPAKSDGGPGSGAA